MNRAAWIVLAALLACNKPKEEPKPQNPTPKKPEPETPKRGPDEPDRVEFQLIFIGVKGARSIPGVTPRRTMDEARRDAEEVLRLATESADVDFQLLIDKYCEPKVQSPGTTALVNYDVKPAGLERVRIYYGPEVGDLAFRLKVGEVGMAAYDAKRNPFGWWVLKRVK